MRGPMKKFIMVILAVASLSILIPATVLADKKLYDTTSAITVSPEGSVAAGTILTITGYVNPVNTDGKIQIQLNGSTNWQAANVNGQLSVTLDTTSYAGQTLTFVSHFMPNDQSIYGQSMSEGISVTVNPAVVVVKKDAIINVTGYTGIYDGYAHGATGTAIGVNGEDLSALLDLGASFTNVPGGTANWSFAGNDAYKPVIGSVEIVITKANAAITVSGYSGIYDGVAHGATGTATGVKSEDLSAGLNLGTTFTAIPGGIAYWTFNGGINYFDANGNVVIQIIYGFKNLTNMKDAKINSSIPLKWQYVDAFGNVMVSTKAAPYIAITNSVGAIVVADSGKSGLQYDTLTNTWQWNWQTKGLTPGAYNISVVSVQTGQVNVIGTITLR